MQSTGIKSAQLLMEVLAGAQDKIGQEISRSGFSQQLSEQHQLIQNTPFGKLSGIVDQSNTSQNISALSKQTPSSSALAGGVQVPEQVTKTNASTLNTPLASASARNLVLNKWIVAQGLAFTDPMALEKVLTDLYLPASARTEIRNAFDDQGQISLQKLNTALSRVISSRSDVAPDGRTLADRIQSLLSGMFQQQSSPQTLAQLGIRLEGSYDFEEFRQLLQRLINQAAAAKLEKSGKSPPQLTREISSPSGRPITDEPSPSRTRLPNQTQSLTTNLVPSFLKEEQDPAQNAKDRARIENSMVMIPEGVNKIPALKADEIAQKELPLPEQGLKRFIEAAISLSTDIASATIASIITAAGGLQNISPEKIPENVLKVLSKIIPESAQEIKNSLPERPQPTEVLVNSPAPAATSSEALGWTSTELNPQATMLASANLAGTSEAVIRGLRMGTVESGLNSGNNPVEGISSHRSNVPGVERIAAPANANFTQNQSGSSENRSFTSSDTAVSSDQYLVGPSDELNGQVSMNELLQKPSVGGDDIFTDVIRSHVESFPDAASQEKLVSNSHNKGDPDKTIQKETVLAGSGDAVIRSLRMGPVENGLNSAKDPVEPISSYRPNFQSAERIAAAANANFIPKQSDSSENRPFTSSDTAVSSTEYLARPSDAINGQVSLNELLQRPSVGRDDIFRDVIRYHVESSPDVASQEKQVSNSHNKGDPDKTIQKETILAGSGDTVIRGLRMGPVENGLNSANNPVEGISSHGPGVPGVENIAAAPNANFTQNQSGSSENRPFSSNDTAVSSNQSLVGPSDELNGQVSLTELLQRPSVARDDIFRDVIRYHVESSPDVASQEKLVSNSPEKVEPDKTIQKETISGSTVKSEMPIEIKTIPKAVGSGVEDPESFPSGLAKERNGAEANRIQGQPDAGKPSDVAASTAAENRASLNLTPSQESLPGESRTSLQNSVELLARSEASGEVTAQKNASAYKERADQVNRSTSSETSAKEAPTEKHVAKASPDTNTSGQFTQDKRSQDGTFWFYKDGVQMPSATTGSSAVNTTEMPSYYVSSMTVELAQRIKELSNQKGFQFTMELEPRHLGRMVVRIGTDSKMVKASITTETEQARDLLSKSSPLLQKELASQGLVLEQLQIDVNSQANAHDPLFQRNGSGSRRISSKQQSVTARKESSEPNARKIHIAHGDTLISLFV